jgi:hypothetical protein
MAYFFYHNADKCPEVSKRVNRVSLEEAHLQDNAEKGQVMLEKYCGVVGTVDGKVVEWWPDIEYIYEVEVKYVNINGQDVLAETVPEALNHHSFLVMPVESVDGVAALSKTPNVRVSMNYEKLKHDLVSGLVQ